MDENPEGGDTGYYAISSGLIGIYAFFYNNISLSGFIKNIFRFRTVVVADHAQRRGTAEYRL